VLRLDDRSDVIITFHRLFHLSACASEGSLVGVFCRTPFSRDEGGC
jgi:hypothetical protein